MSDPQSQGDTPADASAALDRESWLALQGRIGTECGYFSAVGERHWAMYSEDGGSLLVTFDTLAAARARKGQMPHLFEFAEISA
jgi:hypothetical protein